MSESNAQTEIGSTSRRKLLKMFGSAPLLPMSGASIAALLAGCDDGTDGTNGINGTDALQSIVSARFIGMAAPQLRRPQTLARPAAKEPNWN